MRLRFLWGAALLLLCIAAPAAAVDSGGIRGRVTDTSGSPLAGVTVTAVFPGGGRGARTDAEGRFLLAGLPAGRAYSVTCVLEGFATLSVPDIDVLPGQTSELRLSLSPTAALRQRIEVRASPPIVAPAETTTQSHYSSEFVESLPILGRNYQDVLTLAPGVTDVNGDGNPNIHGARSTDVVTLVDGVSTSDPFSGKVGAQLNIESIQEIEVKTAGASAEFGRAQGGFANIVTKSGGNDFEGSFKFFWEGSRLDGDGAGIDDTRLHAGVGERGLRDLTFNNYLPFLSLSGPVAKDRAWYFVTLESISKQEPVNAVNSAFVTGLREFRAFAKITWQPTPSTRLSLSLNRDPQSFLNQGLNGLIREETGFTQVEGGTNTTLKSQSVLSPTVVLEASAAAFESSPGIHPNLGPDTNHNGVLFVDRDGDGFNAASERDPGEDWDQDGAWDVWEDTIIPNGKIDVVEVPDPNNPRSSILVSEDQDHDGRLTPRGGCEGALREDTDCDGHLDNVDEDTNHNGRLDSGEDLDGDHRLDPGTEDRNGNGKLDDTPFPTSTYPYGHLRPTEPDRDYFINEETGITQGPYYTRSDDQRRRQTLRSDLSVFVPAFRGAHDLRTGLVLERESFRRADQQNDITALQPPVPPTCLDNGDCLGGRPESLVAFLPIDPHVEMRAGALTTGAYVQDSWKPMPNLAIGLGLRLERESVNAPGLSFFDPRSERVVFDRLLALSGGEIGHDDVTVGNGDGLINRGILGDPILIGTSSPTQAASFLTDPMRLQGLRHLTRDRSDLTFSAPILSSLYPNVFQGGQVDPAKLSALGLTVQVPETIALINNNLSPRLSLSWDPWANGRTKAFATWGRYYDKLFLNSVVGEQQPETVGRYYLFDPDGINVATFGPNFTTTPDHNVGTLLSKSPPSIHQVDRGLATPFTDEWTAGFEHELAPEVALSVRFIRRHFRDQLQDIDINHKVRIDPVTGGFTDIGGALLLIPCRPAGCTSPPTEIQVPDGKPDLFINDPFFNEVLRLGNFNQARYSAIEVEVRRRLARRWEWQGSYVYSRAQGDAEDFQSRLGNDPSTVESEFGYLDFDQRHVVKVNSSIFLPGDWQIGTAASWSSGLPYSIITRFFAVDNDFYPQFRTRYGYTTTGPQGFQFVPVPRNNERNDAVLDLNVSARKHFVIGRSTASLSFEVFNVLNTDTLRILTFEPNAGETADLSSLSVTSGALQLNATRRFGRKYQVGFQISF